MPANVTQSNVFGQTTTTSATNFPEPSNNETTAAGKLIAHLKWIADKEILNAENKAAWLGIAANQGQNNNPNGMVQGTLLKPTALARSSALTGWTLPSLGASTLTLPPIPDNLKVDLAKLASDAEADLDRLRDSWMAQFLPDITDLAPLDDLLENVLDGTQSDSVTVKLQGLTDEAKARIRTLTDATVARVDVLVAAVRTNLAANYATASSGVSAAITRATDNTANVAWARARDQVAREAARLEDEAAESFASRGFSIPPGAMALQLEKGRQATQSAASEAAAVQAEKSQQQYLDIAGREIDAHLRRMESQTSAEINEYQAVATTKLRAAELMLDAEKFLVRQAIEQLGLTLDFTKSAADIAARYRMGIIGAMNDLIRAYAGLRGTEMEYLNAISRAQVAAQDAVLDYYRAAMANAEIGMRVDVTNNENDLKWTQLCAQFIAASVGHHVHAATAAADVFARTAGMALSGLNGIASVASSS
jgi:hypothetical protein